MLKRGQASQIFVFMIAAIILGVVVIFGYTIFKGFAGKDCSVGMIDLKTDLEHLSESVGANMASGVVKTLRVPCGVDRVLFFDLKKNVIFAGMDEYPLILNSLKDSVQKNIFFIKNGKVYDSIHVENLDIKVPYFMCVNTKNGYLNIIIKSDATGTTTVWPKDSLSDCTYDYTSSIELSTQDTVEVMNGIFSADIDIVQKEIVDPVGVGLTKKIDYGSEDTTITINKETGKFDYYEIIPNCVMSSLIEAKNSGDLTFNGPEGTLYEKDGIIGWNFNTETAEEISYTISNIIEPQCLRNEESGLMGIGLGEDDYPGVSATEQDEIRQHRTDFGYAPFENINSIVFNWIKRENSFGKCGALEAVSELKNNVRRMSVDPEVKVEILKEISELEIASTEAPGEVPVRLLRINESVNDITVFPQELYDIILKCAYKVVDINRLEDKLVNDASSICSITGGSTYEGTTDECFDGEVHHDMCLDETRVMEVTCNADEVCAHAPAEHCSGSNICVDGKCVSPGTCMESDYENQSFRGTCFSNTGVEFKDTCIDQSKYYEFTCNATGGCEKNIVFCPAFWRCEYGECVPHESHCRVEADETGIYCYEGTQLMMKQQCGVQVYNLGPGEDPVDELWVKEVACYEGHCTGVPRQYFFEGSCNCNAASGLIECS